MHTTRPVPLVVAFLAFSLSACGGGSTAGGPPSPQGTDDRLSNAEIETLYRQRMEEARSRFTPADVRFMSNMIHHHAQAIEISRFVPSRASDPQIRTLAARIINAQQDEIATMQRWLAARDQPVPELHEMGTRIMVHAGGGMNHDMMDMTGMPGMLAPEQVDRLEASSGDTFDRLFLTYMIEHHKGAVTMVLELFGTDGAGQDEDVFRFASDVQVDQATEVARMERMLQAIPDGGSLRR